MPVQSLMSHLCNYEIQTFSQEAEIVVKVIAKLREPTLTKLRNSFWYEFYPGSTCKFKLNF